MDKRLKICSTCIPVVGYSRGLICDLDQNRYDIIPNSLIQLLHSLPNFTEEGLMSHFSNQKEVITEYISFLRSKNYLYTTYTPELFPPLNMEWDSPFVIANAIIEMPNSVTDLLLLLKQLSNLFCQYIQLRIDDINELLKIKDEFLTFSFQGIELLSSFKPEYTTDFLVKFIEQIPFISKILITNSPFNKIEYGIPDQKERLLLFTSLNKNEAFSCKPNHPHRFKTNLSFFTESQAHNTCLNRKICIDAEGNIKNCPAMEKSFGNIKDTTLKEAIEKKDFKDLWFIHKDKIEVCKDCEFRHMCSDCRCFIKDLENIYSQPAKCTYNPYICKWQGEANYIPVEECGTYCKETGFIPDAEKIERLNKQIWGD